MKKICVVIIWVYVVFGIMACDNSDNADNVNKESTTAELITSCKEDVVLQNVSNEVYEALMSIFDDSLVITEYYMDKVEGVIEYSKLKKSYKFEETMQSIFDGVIWHRKEAFDITDMEQLNDAKTYGRYYSFVAGEEEWILFADSNFVVHTIDAKTEYFSLWDDKGNPEKPENVAEEYNYIKTYGMPLENIEEEFGEVWQRGLKIEHKLESASLTISFEEMIADAEKSNKLLGYTDFDYEEYMKKSLPGVFRNYEARWYQEDITEKAILDKKQELEVGQYFRLWIDDTRSWLLNEECNEAVYCNNGEYTYYTILSDNEYVGWYLKADFDRWAVEGIDDSRKIQISVVADEMTDDELANKIFDEYKKFFVSVLPDNIYGASDMKMLEFKAEEGMELNGEIITDKHKVFFISYAFKANEPRVYEGLDHYAEGEGSLEGWMVTANNFYLNKIDGKWYLISVSIG